MRENKIISILLAFFAGAGVCWLWLSNRVYQVAKEISKEIVNEVIDEIYPCKLIVFHNYNQDEESIVTDFTNYKSKGLVGLIMNKVGDPPDAKHEAMAQQPLYYKNAVVYKLGDTWLWKVL